MELLILEVGLSDQIFRIKFHDAHFLATDCWLKALWEKITMFDLTVLLGNISCRPPRIGDDWLMAQFTQEGYSVKELIRLSVTGGKSTSWALACSLSTCGRA